MSARATDIVGRLDARARRLESVRLISSGDDPFPARLRSIEEFEDACVGLITNRIIEANSRNEYSAKLDGFTGNIRARSKSLFVRLVEFASAHADPEARKDLFLLLCYVKPESPDFVARVAAMSGAGGAAAPVPSAFVEYLSSMTSPVGANVAGLSPTAHFAGTVTLSLAGEGMPCRIAAATDRPVRRAFCGCSATDSLLFDASRNEFELFVTLPGLSLRHLTPAFLTAVYETIIGPRVESGGPMIEVTVSVGFVDRLKIAGALNGWVRSELETVVDRLVRAALDSVKSANAEGAGRFHFRLYPGSFPVRTLDKVTVNGVAPFHSANDGLSHVLEHRLRATSTAAGSLFPRGKRLRADVLIHDREIHPKLGACLSTIATND